MRPGQVIGWFKEYGGYVAVELGINIVLPIILFDRMQPRYGDVPAVLISGVPSLLWTIVGLIRQRKLDMFACLILLSIIIAIPTFLISGSPRLLLVRDNLSGVLFGLIFLGSAAVKRPLMYEVIYHFIDRGGASESSENGRRDPIMRRAMTVMTVVFGLVLIVQALALVALVFAVSIHTYLIYGPIAGWLGFGAVAAWVIPYYRSAKRRSSDAQARS